MKQKYPCHQSKLSRRRLLQCIGLGPLALQAAPFLSNPVLGQSAGLSVRALNPSLSLVSGVGCNVLVKHSAGKLLVVDGGLEQHAARTLDAVAATAASDNITTLINTHWHREQTGLNATLGKRGVTIFSHINTRQWLGAEIRQPWHQTVFKPLPETARPNQAFYHYGDLRHGDSQVQYGYLRQAHTDGDMYVYFPDDNVLHGGGVVANDGWPLLDWWTGGWIGGLVDGLETLLSLGDKDTAIIPANGPVMTRTELQDMRDMYATIFDRVRKLFMAANSPEETIAAGPADEYAERWGDPDEFILRCHQSLIPHYTPDA